MRALVSATLFIVWASSAQAALVISDVSGADDELSLTVTGTIEADHLNSGSLEVLYFGFSNGGDDSWISSVDETSSSLLDVKHGGSLTAEAVFGYSGYGGYAAAVFTDAIAAGDTINYTFTWIGDFDFSVYSVNDLVVQVGESGIFPELVGGTNIVAGSVVPLPAAFWLFGSGLAGLGLVRRQKSS